MAIIRSFEGIVSKVFSFRLNENNPREARVLEFIQTRASEGYTLRQIIIEGLLMASEKTSELEALSRRLDEVVFLIQKNKITDSVNKDHFSTSREVSSDFQELIKKAVKPGIRLR